MTVYRSPGRVFVGFVLVALSWACEDQRDKRPCSGCSDGGSPHTAYRAGTGQTTLDGSALLVYPQGAQSHGREDISWPAKALIMVRGKLPESWSGGTAVVADGGDAGDAGDDADGGDRTLRDAAADAEQTGLDAGVAERDGGPFGEPIGWGKVGTIAIVDLGTNVPENGSGPLVGAKLITCPHPFEGLFEDPGGRHYCTSADRRAAREEPLTGTINATRSSAATSATTTTTVVVDARAASGATVSVSVQTESSPGSDYSFCE
jgi:hypothetical protein